MAANTSMPVPALADHYRVQTIVIPISDRHRFDTPELQAALERAPSMAAHVIVDLDASGRVLEIGGFISGTWPPPMVRR